MSTSAKPAINGPAHLFAEIPGALGYYPDSAIVLACLNRHGEKHFQLGPVIRVDLENAEALREVPAMSIEADLIFSLVISDDENDDYLVDTAVGVLLECDALPIEGIWHAPVLEQGEPITLLWGKDTDTMPAKWLRGTIPPIFATTTMRAALRKGDLLSEDRATALSAFNSEFLPSARRATIESDIAARTKALAGAGEGDAGAGAVQSIVAEVREALANGDSTDKALALLLFALGGPRFLRDLTLGELIDSPHHGAELALSAVRIALTPKQRINALCAFALSRPDTPGMLALTVAVRESPEHSLTGILRRLSIESGLNEAVPAVMRGVGMTRSMYGIS